jgi:hypothetical protein
MDVELGIVPHFIPPSPVDRLHPLDRNIFSALGGASGRLLRGHAPEVGQTDDHGQDAAHCILAWGPVSNRAIYRGWACHDANTGCLQAQLHDAVVQWFPCTSCDCVCLAGEAGLATPGGCRRAGPRIPRASACTCPLALVAASSFPTTFGILPQAGEHATAPTRQVMSAEKGRWPWVPI